LLRFAICESSVYWVDKATGVPCRCRPDAVATVQGGVVLLDVKTFGNASEFEFSRQVHGMRYHVQDAFYSAGYEDASGLKVLGFVFLVVEDKFPFAAAAYRLDADSRQQGLDEARINLETYAECQKSGVWPGYANTTTVISLPPYAFATQEVEVTYVPE
jgi:exodeoxyribonuclease VIII